VHYSLAENLLPFLQFEDILIEKAPWSQLVPSKRRYQSTMYEVKTGELVTYLT